MLAPVSGKDRNLGTMDDKQGEAASLSDASSSTKATPTTPTSSPGRARRVSMKIKKGLREVKEMLSPHHHDHHSPDGHSEHRRRLLRRKSGPNDSRRGPLAPVLHHLEKSNSVPIHLHISPSGDLSFSRKASSSSTYSCSDIAHDDDSKSLPVQQAEAEELSPPQTQTQTQIEPEPEPEPEPPQQPESQPTMAVSLAEPPQSPQLSDEDGERTPNPFLVDDPEDPLSDPGSPPPAPVPPLDPVVTLPPLEAPPVEPVALTPAQTQTPLPLLPDPELAPPLPVDKPVPALPVSSPESESETGDELAVHLPQLVMPTMFLPIPNVRISSHLTWWLTRRTPIYY